MSNLRFYSPEKLRIGSCVKLSDNAAIHAAKVMRLTVGDPLVLFDGSGFDFVCSLTSIQKNATSAQVLESVVVNNESPLNITLLQGISSGDRMDYSIQKSVELGVKTIQPIATERSVVKLSTERSERRLEHWQNIVIAACEQSGRAVIPTVLPPKPLTNWLASNPPSSITRILLNPIGAKRLSELTKPEGEIQLLIGAEGGLSNVEINLTTQAGFQSIILGSRILRTETAAPTALASLQTLWGDF